METPERPVDLERLTGRIRFEDVHFGYGPDREVLAGLDFEVAPDECVAILGVTGARCSG